MRTSLLVAGLLLVLPTSAFALQLAPSGAGAPGEGPSLRPSMEPDRSTDAAALEDVRFKSQQNRKAKSARVKKDQPRPAALTEVVAGKQVHDLSGQPIALIEKIEADGAVLRAGASAVKVPLDGFGVSKKGLLLNMTKTQFESLVASVSTTPRS